MTTTSQIDQIVATTEARQECDCGEWSDLDTLSATVRDTIAEEILSCMCADMRREQPESGNTDEFGSIAIDGQVWQYRR